MNANFQVGNTVMYTGPTLVSDDGDVELYHGQRLRVTDASEPDWKVRCCCNHGGIHDIVPQELETVIHRS